MRVTTVDDDQQEVVLDEPTAGDFFGFASMLQQTPHESGAIALEETVCVEVDRNDIFELIQRKPHAGMDMLSVLGRQYHAAHQLVRVRSMRNINEVIEAEATFGERIADAVARFGGSWTFIIAFGVTLVVYASINIVLKGRAWDPYPFILLNLFLSMLASVQAPVIMMSQNRQDTKDRLRGELDFDVNRRAESEIQGVSRKLHQLTEKIEDLEESGAGAAVGAKRGQSLPAAQLVAVRNLGAVPFCPVFFFVTLRAGLPGAFGAGCGRWRTSRPCSPTAPSARRTPGSRGRRARISRPTGA